MASRPQRKNLNAVGTKTINAIVNTLPEHLQDQLPTVLNVGDKITGTVTRDGKGADKVTKAQAVASVRAFGDALTSSSDLSNAFLNALMNRIGLVTYKSKMYYNPLEMFKKGMLEYGEMIEDIFVEIAKSHQYNPIVAESEVNKREIPDVKSLIYKVNNTRFYKQTVQLTSLKQAFMSIEGVNDLISRVIDAMYKASYVDEFLMMKFMIAKQFVAGKIKTQSIPEVNKLNASNVATVIKQKSNDLTFLSTQYNQAGVNNNTEKENQYLLSTSQLDAYLDVEVLAVSFNMDKADFMGHHVLVDAFNVFDKERIDALFKDVADYTYFTDAELTHLSKVKAILLDSDYFQVWDTNITMTDKQNEQGLYWNYWLHIWQIYAVCDFANCIALVENSAG